MVLAADSNLIEAGGAQRSAHQLPRLVDTSSLPLVELEGWISGFSDLLPHRPVETATVVPPFYY